MNMTLDEALARATDPQTSHDAAKSVNVTRGQTIVYSILAGYGPMTDVELLAHIPPHTLSPSGARTRRAELVTLGRVRDTGRRQRLESGRFAIVWECIGA